MEAGKKVVADRSANEGPVAAERGVSWRLFWSVCVNWRRKLNLLDAMRTRGKRSYKTLCADLSHKRRSLLICFARRQLRPLRADWLRIWLDRIISIKSRRLMPGGYRDTVTRGWARPPAGLGAKRVLRKVRVGNCHPRTSMNKQTQLKDPCHVE